MGKKILVVDDEDIVCNLVGDLLRTAGYDVIVAQDGRSGLEKARTEVPSLIVLDINLPETAGGAMAALLGVSDETSTIPIIFLTGYIDKDEAEMLNHKFAGHVLVTKPFDTDDLLAKVKMVLNDE